MTGHFVAGLFLGGREAAVRHSVPQSLCPSVPPPHAAGDLPQLPFALDGVRAILPRHATRLLFHEGPHTDGQPAPSPGSRQVPRRGGHQGHVLHGHVLHGADTLIRQGLVVKPLKRKYGYTAQQKAKAQG